MLDRDEAVVMVPSTAVKSSPDRSATDLFVLHEGTEVRVTGRLEPWCEIVTAGERTLRRSGPVRRDDASAEYGLMIVIEKDR